MKHVLTAFCLLTATLLAKTSLAQTPNTKTVPIKKEVITKDGAVINAKAQVSPAAVQNTNNVVTAPESVGNSKVGLIAMLINHPNVQATGEALQFKAIFDSVGGFQVNSTFTDFTPPSDGYYMLCLALQFYPVITTLTPNDSYDVYIEVKQDQNFIMANTSFNNISASKTFISNNYHNYSTIVKLKGGYPVSIVLRHAPKPPFQFTFLQIGSGNLKLAKIN